MPINTGDPLQLLPGDVTPSRSKMSQGELVQKAMFASPAPLVDIGINLVDKSFNGVGGAYQPCRLQDATKGLPQSPACPSVAVQLRPLCTQQQLMVSPNEPL